MRILTTFLCVLLLGFVASTAMADEAPDGGDTKRAVERLQPEELDALKKRLPKAWDAYSAEQQERLARGMLRLRNMTPEQRAKLQRRMDEALAAKKAGVNLEKRFADMRANRSHYDAAWKIGKGTGQLIRESLDAGTKQKLSALPLRMHGRHLDMAFSRLLLDGIITATQEGVGQLDASTLPEPIRKVFVAKREKLASLPAEAKGRYEAKLAHLAVTGQVMQLIAGVERPSRLSREALRGLEPEARKAHMQGYEAYVRAIGLKAKERWPAAFAATVTKIAELADDPQKMGQLLVKHTRGGREGHDGRAPRALAGNPVAQLLLLERHFRQMPDKQALRGHVDALIRALLVETYKRDPANVDAALALEGRERRAALMKLVGGNGEGRGAARPGGKGRPGRGNGRPGGRGVRPGGKKQPRDAQDDSDK